ncbi:MAG: glutamate synthase large subunit [Actinomycetota bacterium]
MRDLPRPQGLYDPRFEHDACGVSFVADMQGRASNEILLLALGALRCLQHRGATNAEPNTGDGAGVLIQVPDRFCRAEVPNLPPAGEYATGMVFLPPEAGPRNAAKGAIDAIVADEGLEVVAWRHVPVESDMLGKQARDVMPSFEQIFIASPDGLTGLDLDRAVYVARKRMEHQVPAAAGGAIYIPSLSSRTMVYKGMLTTPQLAEFFPDLRDERLETALALVHSRFSTNTFPSWPLAHPYRFVAHNGEINTVMGNRNWMRAREATLSAPHWNGAEERMFPICTPGASDTASFDEALELLHLGGYPLHHAVLMTIPEAWEKHPDISDAQRAFYDFYASDMEPWDGPASVTFTDGTMVGAVLDRNGLRPSRYWVTDDDLVVMASEVGVIDVDPSKVVRKGRLEPGKMFLVDTSQGRIIDDHEIMEDLAAEHPYREWLTGRRTLSDLPALASPPQSADADTLQAEQISNGFTTEDFDLLVDPMVADGKEAIGSMGTDTPPAVLSSRPRMLYDYFFQLFAQVTNPPLDAIREALVTSHRVVLGPSANILVPGPDWCRQLELTHPVLTPAELARIVAAGEASNGTAPALPAATVSGLYPVAEGGAGLRAALVRARTEAAEAIANGARVVVLSTRNATADQAPIPALLLTGAVHHHLVREKLRTQAGLIVDAADAREVHHFALLLGCGANAVCPSLTFEAVASRLEAGVDPVVAEANYIKAVSNGVIKVMSKMGISTVASYTGAQIFEAVGLSQELVDEFFTGITSKLGGVGLHELAQECELRHRRAFPDRATALAHRGLDYGGEYQWRREGEYHLFNPNTVFKLQHATRSKRFEVFKEYTELVDTQAEQLATLRGLFRFKTGDRPPVPIDEVEPVSEIVKRFATGAMSYGSISAEAHETLAIAMNRLGGKSNTGEGGEDPERFVTMPNGDSKRSAIKQVASGRFGVTSEYLTESDDIQIKMAQGAKPGEGGQLPGRKVYPWIAKTRHSTTGVGLISPPPHHDIYSIEDLAQLIHDLKNANPEARVHVKLVAEVGVGTVAAGVSKAKADVVLISGNDGGTGASPLTSLKHAGGPWELGLAETQQTLLLNDLRDRIVVQVDGQIKTGRDVIVAALLGAEEFGFATAPLVVSGCIMMRVCHLDTCPVGIATQNPALRAKFSGQPEFVETFFEFIAEEVRQYLAELGFRSIAEAVGQVESLDTERAIDHWKAAGLDLTPILHQPLASDDRAARLCISGQDHGLDQALDQQLIDAAAPALEDAKPVELQFAISNTNRTVGTMLGHELTKRYGGEGLPDDTISIEFTGSAGQSFGAFVPPGITMRLEGDANDYFGKGLSGGHLRLFPPKTAPFVAEENIIAGNVILYGATSGSVHIRGIVGERFCVRNSGAEAVVEGVGDHGCEYMTGGVAVVLGATGRNFGAGMSGGVAYVLDADGTFPDRVNHEMVELEALDAEDDIRLHGLVERHLRETGSPVAERLLADWSTALSQFVKVMPTDYRRVMDAQRRAAEDGSDPVKAMMDAAHG